MDFLNMNFSELFMQKHGKEVVNKIKRQIKKECGNDINQKQIEMIFKIAYLSFWGLPNIAIQQLLQDNLPGKPIEVEEVCDTHKKSINQIQKYMQEAIFG